MAKVGGTLHRFHSALVTGGTGFIGSHIVDALVDQGLKVTVLDDLSSGARDNLRDGVGLIEADVASPGVVDLVGTARPDLVIHAAAQISVPVSVLDPARDRAVNLVGTENIIKGSRAARASRLVFLSSGGAIYGEASGAGEETLPAPQNPYGVHRLAAEAYVQLSGLPYGIVRFSNVCGPRQRPGLEGGVVAIFLEACRTHARVTVFGDGQQARDFLHVNDAVSGTLTVAAASRSGTWNVATGQRTTVLDLLAAVEALVGRQAEVTYEVSRQGDVGMSSLDIGRIRADLGWEPRMTLRRGLEATLRATGNQGRD
jgi:UDP-glucose 4-epimerase